MNGGDSMRYTGYIGTYTKGDSKGIYTFTLDTEKGELGNARLAAELENPTYVTVNHDHTALFAVAKQGSQGGVAMYEIEGDGSLSLRDIRLSEGSSPCHVSVNPSQTQVVAAYYHRGTAEAFPLVNGTLGEKSGETSHAGSGPNKDRQEKPHIHFTGYTPDEKFIVSVDLGTDEVVTYTANEEKWIRLHSLSVHPGSGPRHIVFHPDGKRAYVMTELSNEVIVLDYDQTTGRLTEKQYISTIPEDFTENNQGSAIHVSKDGRFLYAGNRGHDSIAAFSIEQETGLLSLIEITPSAGSWPRDFTLDPSGRYLVGSNQESHNLVLFARNPETGKLTKLDSEIHVPYPVCVKFAE